jgi:hypothetical protein
MNGARFIHDRLELAGWEVQIADAQKVKGLAPLACKTDRIDAWVLAELSRRRAGDLAADLRAGLVILAGGAVFLAWAQLRPLRTEDLQDAATDRPQYRVGSPADPLAGKERWEVLIRGSWLVLTTGMGSDSAVQPSI